MNSTQSQPVRNRWQTSTSLARSAWRVLKLDHKLVGIPILSAGASLLILVVAGLTVLLTSQFDLESSVQGGALVTGPLVSLSWLAIVFYIAIYLALTFVSVYFSAALIAGLLQRFSGKSPTVASAFSAVSAHKGSLLRFSVMTGTVGYILQAIEERVPLAGQVATWLVGAAWAVASMFAIPVIVSTKEKIGPFTATRRSVDVIKKTWGETAILNVGIGLVALVGIVLYALTMIGIGALTDFIVSTINASNLAAAISFSAVGFLGVVGLLGLILVFIMLSAVIKAAIYHYATTGEAPQGFEQDILRASFTPKQASKVFGS